MTTLTTRDEENTFATSLEALSRDILHESDPLAKAKMKAWERFQEMGLPTKKTEVYAYIKLRRLFEKSFAISQPKTVSKERIAQSILPESEGRALVFINGHFHPELSQMDRLPQRLVISSTSKAMQTYGAYITNQWKRMLQEERDPFAMINAALHQQGDLS